MHLKTLTIKGFKSFADAATLEFEPGVSVIVGPNGSGKSNVVDAVGWVLGAQAPSTVRSTKMDDVIFAGTQSRPALGRAEVSLVIDNSSGVLPVEFNEVEISRTLFRSGDSEYALNGVPCRLLDIQELLSDAGVGRHQHVIVSQGQIDAVLNARPEDRRLIIEEAAGVLKYRKRKEKAERRLEATESNLSRLQDLLREVRRQLRPLERQAEAARRHGDVVAELTALRIHEAGREIAGLRRRFDVSRADRREQQGSQEEREAKLGQLDDIVRAAETELTSLGGDDLGDELATFESLREKAKGQIMVIAERCRGVDRDRDSFIDQEVVATLDADAVQVREELTEVDRLRTELDPAMAELTDEEAELSTDRAAFDHELATEGAQQRLPLGDYSGPAPEPVAPVDPQVGAEARRRLLRSLAEVHEERGAADDTLETAEERRRLADADQQTWSARLEALSMALEEARARAGAERLDGVDGVVGTLLDVVSIDDGYGPAFEAAVGEAMTAVVVTDPDAADRALGVLASGDLSGAVLALGLTRARRTPPLGGEPLRAHVRSNDSSVEALLDDLLGHVAVVDGWTEALDAARQAPDGVIVSRDGDRFGPYGWRIGAGSAQVTAAALDEARAEAERADAAARDATTHLASSRSTAEILRRREGELSSQLGRAFDDARTALDARARELGARRTDLEVRQAGLDERKGVLTRRLGELEQKLERHADERDGADQRLAQLEQRASALGRLSDHVGDKLREIEVHLTDLRERRRVQSEATRDVAARLDGHRRDRHEAERELAQLREKAQRAEIEQAELKMKLEAAIESLRRELETEPDDAIEAPCPELPEGVTGVARIRELERELRIMGPINPLALQEFEALKERHEFLQTQLDDVKTTRRELNKVIKEIDQEIVAVFAAAFADVSQNFTYLFETLFPGGRGRLTLTNPEDILATGIEVEARPSGKNVKKLSLLSGGERSLTALAYLFAVFRSRPSPFYVMDEVEAALDDINLHRFLGLVGEFRNDAQLVIVSHQKRTMEAGDCLYGVSMQSGGSSKVVSERVAEVDFAEAG